MTDPETDADAAFSFQAKIVVYFNGSLGNIYVFGYMKTWTFIKFGNLGHTEYKNLSYLIHIFERRYGIIEHY